MLLGECIALFVINFSTLYIKFSRKTNSDDTYFIMSTEPSIV
jgi:hypothetical protein